jgi:hypothetical protein
VPCLVGAGPLLPLRDGVIGPTQAGEWLVVTRYSSWEVYGKAQQGLAKDPDFAKLMANTANIAELSGRNITVGIDL